MSAVVSSILDDKENQALIDFCNDSLVQLSRSRAVKMGVRLLLALGPSRFNLYLIHKDGLNCLLHALEKYETSDFAKLAASMPLDETIRNPLAGNQRAYKETSTAKEQQQWQHEVSKLASACRTTLNDISIIEA